VGGLVELASNLFPALPVGFIDVWIPTLALPGFLGGVIFSGGLRVAAGDRGLEGLSFPGMAAWGAGSGLLLGGLLLVMGAGPLILVPAVFLSTVGALLTLGFARLADGGRELGPGEDPASRRSLPG
jgi:hypothetical protein